MKNNTIKFVTFSLLAAVAFLVYPVILDYDSQDAKPVAQSPVVNYVAEEASSLPGLTLL